MPPQVLDNRGHRSKYTDVLQETFGFTSVLYRNEDSSIK